MSSDQNPGSCCIWGIILPTYIEMVIGHEIRIPDNQSVSHGMSCQGFVAVARLGFETHVFFFSQAAKPSKFLSFFAWPPFCFDL